MKDFLGRIAANRPAKALKWYLAGVLTVLVLLPSLVVIASTTGVLGDIFSDFNIRVNGHEFVVNWDEETRTLNLESPEGVVAPGIPGAALGPGVYLESDILGTISVLRDNRPTIDSHPASGAFTMRDQVHGTRTFHRGLAASGTTLTDMFVTYDISGRGFTRLTGYVGRVMQIGNAHTVTILADGRFIGGFENGGGNDVSIFEVYIEIPPGTNTIEIRFGGHAGFGDAAFR